jgi:predicted DsbA family dithiol-disulfide isomerase
LTTAPVTVTTFVDITDQWGFGRKAIAAWNHVLARYPDDVRVVVKLCPRKPEDHLAAEAIHAADAQGALWPMLERVAAAPERVTLEDLVEHARTLSLDLLRFRGDLEQRNFRDAVELDQAHQVAMDIDTLPSAIVNGARVHGALRIDSYLRAIENVLRSVRPLESTRRWRRSASRCS